MPAARAGHLGTIRTARAACASQVDRGGRATAERCSAMTLVTKQTGPAGQARSSASMSRKAATSRASSISRMLVDRATGRDHHHRLDRRRHGDRGGRGHDTRRRSSSVAIDPATGIQAFHGRKHRLRARARGQAGRRLRQVRRRPCTGPSPSSTARWSRSIRWSSPARATSSRSMPR